MNLRLKPRAAAALLAIGAALATDQAARAADIATIYNGPAGGPLERIPGVVIMCPSIDGSVTAVPCVFGSGGSGGSGGPVTQSGSWTVGLTSGTTVGLSAGSAVIGGVTQSGSWSVSLGGTLPAFAATPTFNLGTAPSLAISNFPATQAVSGTVGLSGTLPAFASPPTVNLGSSVTLGGTLPAFGATPTFNLGTAPSLTIGNFPSTQTVAGTVSLGSAIPSGTNTIGAVQGPTASGSQAQNPPIQMGGVDGSGNVRTVLTDTSGRVITMPGNSPGTDSSANAPSGLSTTLTSFTVTTPGAYYVQNQSAAPIQVDLCTSVGVNCTIVLLASGGAAGAQGADTTPPIPWFTGYVAVVGASGSQIAARHN
jgi:hypothetical protein